MSSKQVIEGALKMKNMMRPGPMESRQAMTRRATPTPLAQMRPTPQPAPKPAPQPIPQPTAQPAMFAPEPQSTRRGVYAELMKKHDSLNPRIKI